MQLLTARQAAQMLGVKTLFLYQLIQKRKIPYRALPGNGKRKVYRFDKDELEAWVKEQ